MIEGAIDRKLIGANFLLMDLTDNIAMNDIKDKFDLITAIFSFNYLKQQHAKTVTQWAVNQLQPRGSLIVTHPHPLVTYSLTNSENFKWQTVPNYFNTDTWLTGEMRNLQNETLDVGSYHKTLQDLLSLVPVSDAYHFAVEELGFVCAESCPPEFSELIGKPLHVKITISKR